MNELTVINGLTSYNESVSVHQAYLLFRILLLNRCLGKVLWWFLLLRCNCPTLIWMLFSSELEYLYLYKRCSKPTVLLVSSELRERRWIMSEDVPSWLASWKDGEHLASIYVTTQWYILTLSVFYSFVSAAVKQTVYVYAFKTCSQNN